MQPVEAIKEIFTQLKYVPICEFVDVWVVFLESIKRQDNNDQISFQYIEKEVKSRTLLTAESYKFISLIRKINALKNNNIADDTHATLASLLKIQIEGISKCTETRMMEQRLKKHLFGRGMHVQVMTEVQFFNLKKALSALTKSSFQPPSAAVLSLYLHMFFTSHLLIWVCDSNTHGRLYEFTHGTPNKYFHEVLFLEGFEKHCQERTNFRLKLNQFDTWINYKTMPAARQPSQRLAFNDQKNETFCFLLKSLYFLLGVSTISNLILCTQEVYYHIMIKKYDAEARKYHNLMIWFNLYGITWRLAMFAAAILMLYMLPYHTAGACLTLTMFWVATSILNLMANHTENKTTHKARLDHRYQLSQDEKSIGFSGNNPRIEMANAALAALRMNYNKSPLFFNNNQTALMVRLKNSDFTNNEIFKIGNEHHFEDICQTQNSPKSVVL